MRFPLLLAALAALAGTAHAQPNLIPSDLTVTPHRGDPGETISVTLRVRSVIEGTTEGAPAFDVAFYLSEDVYLDDGDTRVARTAYPAIERGGSATETTTFPVPNLPRGGYVLLISVDDPDQVAETDETDNLTFFIGLTIGGAGENPDFVFGPGGELEDPVAAPGDRISVEYTIVNQGGSNVGDFEVGYYFSPDFACSPSTDVFAERETLGGLEEDEEEDESEQVTVPEGLAPGNYHFCIVADDQNAVEEGNEVNNTFGFQITITAATATESGSEPLSLVLTASPNPTAGPVHVSFEAPAGPVRLSVYDVLGRKVAVVLDRPLGGDSRTVEIDTSRFPAGTYTVRLVTPDGSAAAFFTVTR